MSTESQNQMILRDMRRGWKQDPLKAKDRYGSWALSSRISEIEGKSGHKLMLKRGEKIERIPVKSKGKRYMSYALKVAA